MVRVATAQDPESVPSVCGGIAANTPTNVGVSFLGQKKGRTGQTKGQPGQKKEADRKAAANG